MKLQTISTDEELGLLQHSLKYNVGILTGFVRIFRGQYKNSLQTINYTRSVLVILAFSNIF